jgi:CBS domain-containing protein
MDAKQVQQQTLGGIASSAVVVIDPQALLTEALALMSERRISCLVAVLQGTPVGILTERDVVLAANKVLGFGDLRVRDLMTSPVFTADSRAPAFEAWRLLRENGIRHLVLVDADYELAGIFTLTDLLHTLPDHSLEALPPLSGIMSAPVRTIGPRDPVRRALSKMSRRSISCLVVAEAGRPVGMFTERDVARLVAQGFEGWADPVGTVMSPPAGAAPASLSARGAIALMREKEIRRLVVVDDRGGIAGLVTQSDIGRALEWHLALLPEAVPAP